MVIGITDPMRDEATYAQYVAFVKRSIPEAETRILSCLKRSDSDIGGCDAVVFTGGSDVHPKFYDSEEMISRGRDVNIARDLFEFDIIREVVVRRLPTLGICRGSQVFNVAMGGTLIPDLDEAGRPGHKRGDASERLHEVRVVAESMLHSIVGFKEGSVNTSHHQAVDIPGRGLRVTARADDGVVEALEWEEPAGKPFLLLVQWHPERMNNPASPFARNIMERFASEIRAVKKQ